MKNAKSAIAFIFLVVFCVSVAWAEYGLVMRSGISFSVAITFTLLVVGGLFRAPEGYEDKTGFHIGALGDVAPA